MVDAPAPCQQQQLGDLAGVEVVVGEQHQRCGTVAQVDPCSPTATAAGSQPLHVDHSTPRSGTTAASSKVHHIIPYNLQFGCYLFADSACRKFDPRFTVRDRTGSEGQEITD